MKEAANLVRRFRCNYKDGDLYLCFIANPETGPVNNLSE